ncbi:N-acetylglucosamine-6-phosphate deacetylase NagA domain protein [Mycobacterium ulcerans str. Harvey]|uniref:N-acetylglucosamine-6-phosphate deacetylase NagA domain protein n=1 Tax=Mycobacterium ulcerans str. Harvey TaxID=1299332 RepID=A0ABN0R241_MYCUL|nr:N-acetylglucosamine-6-phosphate deacetylase NagA domain protein [Mycobacterium ulcerans str. Harvey]
MQMTSATPARAVGLARRGSLRPALTPISLCSIAICAWPR